ncbi:spore germination protein [Bacillus sp. HNG]|uniref:spore germination protein n=1 Tax=Bacillus sp. HNG TaxID=2293325 RepID=UPI000E2E9921|nr:spore germination protein [Bacillus sp. HNG]RFB11437.1 spore germination protein [Bacillus sp. HNG]
MKHTKDNQEGQSKELEELGFAGVLDLFKDCDDVSHQTIVTKRGCTMNLVYCQGLYDKRKYDTILIPSLKRIVEECSSEGLNMGDFIERLDIPPNSLKDIKELISRIFNGEIFIYMNNRVYFTVDISDHPKRNPQDPNTEISIKGARDGFVEEIGVNIALIRKRLRTNSLVCKSYIIGERTQTKVALLYVDDIINKGIKDDIQKRLSRIKIDGIVNSNQLKELLSDSGFDLLPILDYTGRPDLAVDCLLRGRFLVLVDGIPTIAIGPGNLTMLFKSAEDNEYNFLYNSFERILRFVGLFVSTFLPGIWIALITIHQDQLPFTLLAVLVESRKGVPLPSAVEATIMLLLFSLFREAGLRLPVAIGQTLSVIGGLIIGDAAIRAGLTNPAMLVVIATSEVATYTLVNLSLTGAISVYRFVVLLLAGTLGFWGVFLAIALLLIYTAQLRPFGIPYLAPFTLEEPKSLLNIFFRIPWKWLKTRPRFLKPQDSTKQE